MLGHAAPGDLFSDFSFFCFYYVFHLRSCQECGKWDSQAARVTVQHRHHHYHHHQYYHHHNHCHHRYYHPAHSIIIIFIIILLFPQARK